MHARRLLFAATMLGALAACRADAGDEPLGASSSSLVVVGAFGSNPGQLTMAKYVPAGMPSARRPLVVALHGCGQTAEDYTAAGWNALADAYGFYVVYAEQSTTKNNLLGCFNWAGRWPSAPAPALNEPLDTSVLARGRGENQSIKEMVDKMKADHPIDASRVYVTGLSAGGAMTAVMLATWPEVFAGGAIFAGIPYGCASVRKTTAEAAACLGDTTGGSAYLDRTPGVWGDLVRAAAPQHTGPWPRVSLWHGAADTVVSPRNQGELLEQWTSVHGVDAIADATDTAHGVPHEEYRDASGTTVVEVYRVTGMRHGNPVSPSEPVDPAVPGAPACGASGAYALDVRLCAPALAARFFGLTRATDRTDAAAPVPDAGPEDAGAIGRDAREADARAAEKDGGPTVSPTPAEGGGCSQSGAPRGATLGLAMAVLLLGLARRRRA